MERHVQGQFLHREHRCLGHIAKVASLSQRPLLARARSPSSTEARPRCAAIAVNEIEFYNFVTSKHVVIFTIS